MGRVFRIALVLAVAPLACGKVTAPGETTDAGGGSDGGMSDAAVDLTPPVAAITSIGLAGTQAQCSAATPASGPGSITYVASWTIDGFPFTGATTTALPGDTIPGAATHTGGVATCTLFASNGHVAAVSAPVSITFQPRLAYVMDGPPGAGVLRTIDLDSFAITTIGPVVVDYQFGDLAWDAVNQKLFMVDGRPERALYAVDTTTGSATEIGVHGATDMFALGFDGSGDLYGGVQSPTGSDVALHRLDPATGSDTPIGGTEPLSGLAFDSTRGEMVGLSAFSGDLTRIDLATGSATPLVGTPPSIADCGMTYDPFTDKLFAVDNGGEVYRYDPQTNYSRAVVHQYPGSTFTAIAIILPPP